MEASGASLSMNSLLPHGHCWMLLGQKFTESLFHVLHTISLDILHFSFKLNILPRPLNIYNGPCDLRPPIQPAKYGLKLRVVLKQRDVYTENIQVVSLIHGLKMQGIVKYRGFKMQGPLYTSMHLGLLLYPQILPGSCLKTPGPAELAVCP